MILGACTLAVSSLTLLLPGTFLDRIWEVNPESYLQMLPYRIPAGIGFVFLCIFMSFAARGWLKGKKWGWVMVIAVFIANGIGDIARIAMGDPLGGLFGIVVASVILYFLTRPRLRNQFV